MTGRQVGDERARYGRKSFAEQLDETWATLVRYRLWIVVAAVLIGIGLWLMLLSRNVPVADVRVGDCLYVRTDAVDDPTTSAPIGTESDVERVLEAGGAQRTDCTSSHGHEVSVVVPLPIRQVTQNAFRTDVATSCDSAFAAFTGQPLTGSAFVTFSVVPTPEQWDAGSRVGFCLVARADGQWLTSPARGSGG